jgi:hypothetical protein
MGLNKFAYWASWFVFDMLTLVVSVTIVTGLLFVGGVLVHSDGTLVFVFLLVFSVTTIAFCFFVSVLFSKAVGYFFVMQTNYSHICV